MKKKCETGGPLIVPESTAVKIIQPMHPQINVPSSTDMLLKKLISSTVPNGSFSSTTKSADKIYEKGDGGALDTALPVVPAILGAINPALGAVAGAGVKMYQSAEAQQETPSSATMVNSNPYGFASGGTLNSQSTTTSTDPILKQKSKQKSPLQWLIPTIMGAVGLGLAATKKDANKINTFPSLPPISSFPSLPALPKRITPSFSNGTIPSIGLGQNPVQNNPYDQIDYTEPVHIQAQQGYKSNFDIAGIGTYAELGGMLKGIEGIEQFVGDKHSDPSGGISVSPGGVPVSDSNQKVEDGETVFDIGGGRKYVFSAKLVI